MALYIRNENALYMREKIYFLPGQKQMCRSTGQHNAADQYICFNTYSTWYNFFLIPNNAAD